jgi:hypothetical protein
MYEPPQLAEWLLFAAVFLFAPILFTRQWFLRFVTGERMERVRAWASSRMNAEDEPEEIVYLRALARADRLREDLRRIKHLLATDTYMSAVRQLGNRLAYEQLLDQLRREPELLPPHDAPDWSRVVRNPASVWIVQGDNRSVETLDIGWRS